ncbi:MAG: hypothetical protein C5B49_06895 [Bdellovibrio sp.]|nr:MAG: hypothetical protein C5B49_06895 [Bdellovibrio sp.]
MPFVLLLVKQNCMHIITTFYFFKAMGSLADLPAVRKELEQKGRELGLHGLFILAPEGLNTTCSGGSETMISSFKSWIKERFNLSHLDAKDSLSERAPFGEFKVKIRPEICTLGSPGLVPTQKENGHLSAEEWERVLREEKNVVLIDTRNDYEYDIGTFQGAINPKIEQFSDFPDFVEEQGYEQDQKILIFCTGGVRCEKAILDLQQRGYTNVLQLQGGILNYLQKFPRSKFLGECFVFDQRVALDQDLQPTRQYCLCPHCGQPGKIKLNCIRCDGDAVICARCASRSVCGETCSKNCAHHYALSPKKKGRRQWPSWRRLKACEVEQV